MRDNVPELGLKSFCDGEPSSFFEKKEGCEVSCVKIFLSPIYQKVSIYLKYYKPHSLSKLKENVVKSECLEKRLRSKAAIFFPR